MHKKVVIDFPKWRTSDCAHACMIYFFVFEVFVHYQVTNAYLPYLFLLYFSCKANCLRDTGRGCQRQTDREREVTLLISQRKTFQMVSTHQTINTKLSQITATSSVFSNGDRLDKLPFVCLSVCLHM